MRNKCNELNIPQQEDYDVFPVVAVREIDLDAGPTKSRLKNLSNCSAAQPIEHNVNTREPMSRQKKFAVYLLGAVTALTVLNLIPKDATAPDSPAVTTVVPNTFNTDNIDAVPNNPNAVPCLPSTLAADAVIPAASVTVPESDPNAVYDLNVKGFVANC